MWKEIKTYEEQLLFLRPLQFDYFFFLLLEVGQVVPETQIHLVS